MNPSEDKIPPTPRNRRHWVLLSYDIPDDKRRTKVMKTLAGYGQRVQYSVFECEIRPADHKRLEAQLRSLIHKEQDDVRLYQLCEACTGRVTMLGKARMHRQEDFVIL